MSGQREKPDGGGGGEGAGEISFGTPLLMVSSARYGSATVVTRPVAGTPPRVDGPGGWSAPVEALALIRLSCLDSDDLLAPPTELDLGVPLASLPRMIERLSGLMGEAMEQGVLTRD